jgi:hypothetical protein
MFAWHSPPAGETNPLSARFCTVANNVGDSVAPNLAFNRHMPKSPIMELFLEWFKAAVAEGAAVELKLRMLSGKVSALEKYAHQKHLEDIEGELAKHFGAALSAKEKETLRLCRQLRNKVLHSDFYAMREKLKELGQQPGRVGVTKIEFPVPTVAEFEKKIEAVKAGTEGIVVADTSSTDAGGIYGWLFEVGGAGDFERACDAFKKAQAIVDRLAGWERSSQTSKSQSEAFCSVSANFVLA